MCNKNTQHGSRCTTTIPTIGRFLVVFTFVSYCFSPAECCLRGVDPVRYLSASGELSNGGNLPSAMKWDSYLLGNALRVLEDADESSGFPWQLVLLQLACCVVIIGVSLFGIFLPKIFLRLSRKENGFFRRHARMVESCCNGFAAGAFWGLALFHVLFEATDILSHNDIGFHVGINFYNMVYMLSFLGYLFILVVDRLLQVVAAKTAEKFAPDSSEVTMLPGGGSGTAKARADTLKSLETILTGLDNRSAIVQGVCTTIALAIHSFFEGMVIGMRDEYTIIAIMTVSVIGHKWAAAFALSQKLISYNVPRKAKIAMLTIFVSSSPLGIIVGMPLAAASDVIVGVFDALTVGILIYVASDTTRDVFRSTNWEALLAKTRKAKSMTQARDVPLSASKTTTTNIANSSGVRGDQYLEMMSHQHDHSSHKHCDSKVDSEECCAECCLTTQDTEEDISSLMVSLVETTKSLKDPLVASYSALFFRILFICAGAALIFGMMFVHLSSEDEHPPCIVSM